MKKSNLYFVQTALIAAIYAALTLALPALSYGQMQIRISEALTILAVFTPASIPGLAIGCFIANMLGPFTYIDAIFGTLATLLAAIFAYKARNIRFRKIPFLSFSFPVIFNAIIIGLEIHIFFINTSEPFSIIGFLITALWVGFGEIIACFVMGVPLFIGLDKTKIFNKLQ